MLPASAWKLPEILPLENGDRLTREEFGHRYGFMPDVKKAELIEGVVYMPSPVRNMHSYAHGQIMVWLGTYCAMTPGIKMNDNATVRLDKNNEVQPDALLRIEPEAGGHSRISKDDYIEGSPELTVEIAASSSSYDLHDKMKVYRRNRVQEYIVWRVYERKIDWFEYRRGSYHSLRPDADGIIKSQVFPGLHLPIKALLEDDLARVLDAVRKGTDTAEHEAFVRRLNAIYREIMRNRAGTSDHL